MRVTLNLYQIIHIRLHKNCCRRPRFFGDVQTHAPTHEWVAVHRWFFIFFSSHANIHSGGGAIILCLLAFRTLWNGQTAKGASAVVKRACLFFILLCVIWSCLSPFHLLSVPLYDMTLWILFIWHLAQHPYASYVYAYLRLGWCCGLPGIAAAVLSFLAETERCNTNSSFLFTAYFVPGTWVFFLQVSWCIMSLV